MVLLYLYRFLMAVLWISLLQGTACPVWAFTQHGSGNLGGVHSFDHFEIHRQDDAWGYIPQGGSSNFIVNSDIREKDAKAKPMRLQSMSKNKSKYEIYCGYLHWLKGEEYRQLYQTIVPKTHLENYFEIGILLRQSFLSSQKITTEERFFSISKIGLGCGATISGILWKNSIFALSPFISAQTAFVSTGLKHYHSRQSHLVLGGEVVLLPKAYLIFIGGWNPYFKLLYGDRNEQIHSMRGKGWQSGIRFCIPRHIIPMIPLGAWDFDLERFWWEWTFHHVKDSSTGLSYWIRRFKISYGLNR